MKKIILFGVFLLFIIPQSFAKDCEILEDDFDKFRCRVETSCEAYEENKKIFLPESYKTAKEFEKFEIKDVLMISGNQQKALRKSVATYKENMNNIYKCALIEAQKNSLSRIKSLPTQSHVKSSLEPKINEMIQKLNTQSKSNKCLSIDKNTVFNKLSILRQTTHQTCEFSFYMEYLKTYYSQPDQALQDQFENSTQKDKDKMQIAVSEANKIINNNLRNIESELEQAYKVFPIAYHAYSEYENNFPAHFLMGLLRQDFYTFRQKLHEVLNPINQVVYKISNAMKK